MDRPKRTKPAGSGRTAGIPNKATLLSRQQLDETFRRKKVDLAELLADQLLSDNPCPIKLRAIKLAFEYMMSKPKETVIHEINTKTPNAAELVAFLDDVKAAHESG